MASLWTLFTCCCVRQRSDTNASTTDERSRLLSLPDEPPIIEPRTVDRQKLKDRLITVLQSKEGRMVNVNSQFPFNLHNQVLGEPSSSRSTRSASGGTASVSRQRSCSPRRVVHRSYSAASLLQRPEDSSFDLPSEDDGDVDGRRPLNVKLVKSAGRLDAIRGGQSRGRARLGRWVRPVISEPGFETAEVQVTIPTPEAEQEDLEVSTPRPDMLVEEEMSPTLGPSDTSTDASVSHPKDFTIHDAGAISCSWGD